MKTRALVAATVLVLLAAPTTSAGVGVPDGNGHPNVGAIAVEFEPGARFVICSGSLVSPTVFLTAAHCLAFLPTLGIVPRQVSVTFASNALASSAKYITATGFAFDPLFGHDLADLHDLGVITLPSRSTKGIAPASLPTAGLLDQMAEAGGLRDQLFENVGYGVVPTHKAAPSFEFDGERRTSTSPFAALTQAWLKLLMNTDADAEGGSCFGDSGSPKFIAGTNTIVATTTGGDPVCRAENINYRLDTPAARAFLGGFVKLP